LDGLFDDKWFSSELFSGVNPGIPSIISVLSIIWATRILALSIQRGLKIVFPSTKNRNPVSENLVMFVIEAVVIIFILLVILSSRTAMWIYSFLDFSNNNLLIRILTSKTGNSIFNIFILGLAAFFLYVFVPVKSPKKLSAFQGALFFIISYSLVSAGLGIILDISRYNFIYGTLGNLIVLLVNVFFFFNLFFIGAQLTFTINSFDALFMIKLRQIINRSKLKINQKKQFKNMDLFVKLFYVTDGDSNKNIRYYIKDEVIISQEDSEYDIYYLLEGEAEVTIVCKDGTIQSIGNLEAGSFFGEMRHLISGHRNATVRAKTNVTTLLISPKVFDEMLKYDTSLDRDIIEQMSRRIKDITEQIRNAADETIKN